MLFIFDSFASYALLTNMHYMPIEVPFIYFLNLFKTLLEALITL